MAQVGQDARKLTDGITRYAKRAAIALAGIGTAAAVVGSSFEFELMKTATVAQAFGKDLEDLRKKARELGATTSFTAKEAAKGMYDLASAGMTTKEILTATGSAMKLAGATASDMSQATHIVAATLKQFNLDATESKRIVDTYAGAITKSLLTMDKLTEAMKYAGTTGAALGWSIEETTAAVAQFAQLGLEGTMSGTNLRMAMIALSRQSDQMTEALREMGLTFHDVNPQTSNFGEILLTLGERSMDAKQAVDIFGARAGLNMRQLSQLAREGATDFNEFVEMLKKAQEGQGRAATMYDRMMNTFKGRWDIMLSALKETGIELFYTFADPGKKAFDFLTDNLNKLTKWISQNRKPIQTAFLDIFNVIINAGALAGKTILAMGPAWHLVKKTILGVIETITEKIGGYYKSLGMFILKRPNLRALVSEDSLRRLFELSSALKLFSDVAGDSEEAERKALLETMEGYEKKAKAIDEARDKGLKFIEMLRTEMPEGGYGPKTLPGKKSEEEEKKEKELPDYEARFRQEIWFENQKLKIIKDAGYNRFAIVQAQNAQEMNEMKKKHEAQIQQWWAHGANEQDIETLLSEQRNEARYKELNAFKQTWESKLEIADQMAGGLAQITETLYTSGISHNKKMFAMMKVFQMAQAGIQGAMAVLNALASPYPWPIPAILATMAGAMAAVQIAAISKQEPQGYQEGGIVRGVGDGRGRTVRVGERGDEAIIPLKGGAVPVAIKNQGKGTTIERHYHFEGSTFLDQATLKASMASIAVGAFENDYKGDGRMRTLVRAQP